MPNVKITDLPVASAIDPINDSIPVVHGGATDKATPNQIVAAVVNAVPLAVSQGGTGSNALANGILVCTNDVVSAVESISAGSQITGLGGMAFQQANAVNITGGTITGASITAGTATNIGSGSANQIPFQSGPGATQFITAPTDANTFLAFNGSNFEWENGTIAAGVNKIIAGTDITISPTDGTGDVTVHAKSGVANGLATLDGSGTLTVSQIPEILLGAVDYQGAWNAATNTPTLTSSVGTKGYYYVVSEAGSTDLDGITTWGVGDWAIFNGSIWQSVVNTNDVVSVNGQTGTVVLTNTDISGFGTMSTQDAGSVSITGGTITGVTIPGADVTGYVANATTASDLATGAALSTPATGDFSTGTFTWPEFNQNTSGSAANIGGGSAGQVLYQSAVNTTAKVTVGTDGQILTLASGLPVWADAVDPVTVADLPAGSLGQRNFVTDAIITNFGEVVEGGGTIPCPVYFDGTYWRMG